MSNDSVLTDWSGRTRVELPRRRLLVLPMMTVLVLAAAATAGEGTFEVPLENPSFSGGLRSSGVPVGWSRYGGGGQDQGLEVLKSPDDRKVLLIADGDPTAEVGISQAVRLKGGETYQVSADVRAVQGASGSGAYLQLRFLPSNRLIQTGLAAKSPSEFTRVAVKGMAPPDTTHGVIYLYTHREPTPRVCVTDVNLLGGLPPPPPPPPPPIPPQYHKLKDLHLEIPLVRAGKPTVAIVAPTSGDYQDAAIAIQTVIENRTGIKPPIVSDDVTEAAVPLRGNLIVLGDRSTNETISALYDRYYCLTDLKYPGPEGYIIRTVHNPFGNGHSVVVVGGSDAVGVDAGARVLANLLAKTSAKTGDLSIGWTMETRLGKGVEPPAGIRDFETWEASRGYGSSGYFGWCSISKRMAMYYMTGDEFSAREFVRLAFPEKQAIRDIEEIDGERIENKRDPLAGFYHYNAHMAILFWDLIEESPVFSDEQRLRITNAFARQLAHRKGEGVYRLTQPPRCVGSRHGQWSAISLYCLGRYFHKDYPDPIWAQCLRGGQLAFAPLNEHAWVAGESDNLFWYNTGIAPIFTYLALTGDRKPMDSGVVQQLLRGQEALISGREKDGALNSASVGFLHKAAYLTGDGRWITYRELTGVDTNVFRLGQSFWPDNDLKPQPPADLVGKWTVMGLPKPAWEARRSGLPWDKSFYFGSYRSAADASGDYILLDGFNGASRNPYHTFAILQLRLGGHTFLDGYHNQVLTSADGMVEPAVAMNAALIHADVVGSTAVAVGETPGAAYCNWRRTLAQRVGRYALVADDLTFHADSQNMTVNTTWQVPGGRWDPAEQVLRQPSTGAELHCCDIQDVQPGRVTTMTFNGAVKPGDHRFGFYLIGQTDDDSPAPLRCVRIAANAAALALPEPAVVVAGEYEQTKGELVILAESHLFGRGLTSAAMENVVAQCDIPIDLDWDFTSGVANLVAPKAATLTLRLSGSNNLRLDGQPTAARRDKGLCDLVLTEGRHVITGAFLTTNARDESDDHLDRLLSEGRKQRAEALAATSQAIVPEAERLPATMSAQVEGAVVDMIAISSVEGTQLAIAAGNSIRLLTLEGKTTRTLKTDDKIRVLHWWDGPALLLAGCVDEQVIAYDISGKKQWSFTSKMDSAVYEAAKTYWFKSARGHEGIHGLYTGEFDQGRRRCFVGSACTLEILDETGRLVKRTPVFWGPGRMFQLVRGPADSKNLLISRWPNGNDHLAIVNSETLAVTGRGYSGLPAGHTYVGGWTAQNRTGLFYVDLDGDGRKEVATAVNGTWNRVTIYAEDGKPLYNAQFGPGPGNAPRSRLRDMDVVDLDNDGKLEIVVGLSDGLVVALDHQCRKVWSTRLNSPPVSLQCIAADAAATQPAIVVGCDNGKIVFLDAQAAKINQAKVSGRPTHMKRVQTPAGPLIVVATDQGEVTGYCSTRAE